MKLLRVHRLFSLVLTLGLLESVPLLAQEPAKIETPSALKDRLRKHEADLLKIRQAMLKEVDDELKKLDDAIQKAEKERTDAKNDPVAIRKAIAAVTEIRTTRQRVQMLRFEVERMVHIHTPPAPRPRTPEQRMGIVPGPVSSVLLAQLNLEKGKGVVIERVEPKSVADTAGLKVSDILLQVDGKPVPAEMGALRRALGEIKADAAFDVVVLRQGKQETLKGLKLAPETPK